MKYVYDYMVKKEDAEAVEVFIVLHASSIYCCMKLYCKYLLRFCSEE